VAKPAYSLIYAILIAVGLLALVLFNRMLASDEAAPAAQASLQRNQATVRETREEGVDSAEKAAPGERAERAETATEKADTQAAAPSAAPAEGAAATAGKDEDARR